MLRANRALGREASLFSQAVAERLGLALTDVECLDILAESGPVTAGRLSELSGLTTGATTRMIDRLEQAGYVRRVADPADRRRVMVETVAERMRAIAALHQSIMEAENEVVRSYGDAELLAISEFLERSIGVAQQEARRIREPAAEGEQAQGASFAAPLAGIANARLVFLSGAPNVLIHGDAGMNELYRARFAGAVPRVRVRGNVVTVGYPKFGWFDWRASIAGQNLEASLHWRKDRGDLAVNSKVRWAIELRGGASRISADLRSVDLESFELRGGAGKIDLDLAVPAGVVPIRLNGGMSHLNVRRPPGVAIGVALRGGASFVALDGEQLRGSGPLSIESPHASEVPDRFELEIAGGAGKIVVGTR